MAGGPLFPHSAYPVTAGRVFPNFHVGAGANSKHDEGLGVEASVGADSIWRLRFQLPPAIPTGTAKLLLRALANATSGNAKVNPKWAKVTAGSDPSSASLNAEGTQTISWAAGDADDYKDTLVALDAVAIGAGDEKKEIVMDLTFETSSWTLAQVSTWIVSVIWE
jgi:hypothetical protein